ncbi:hypothetical protein LINGRAHAP2_LOCUS8314 [Linum grandiflorum]
MFSYPFTFSSHQAHLIEGYTDPVYAEHVSAILAPGTIYKINRPRTVRTQSGLRSCPGNLTLEIKPHMLLNKIHEDPAVPFFPVDRFTIVTLDRIPILYCPSMNLPILQCSYTRAIVRYSDFQPYIPFNLNRVTEIEKTSPVICILTCVRITDSEGMTIILLTIILRYGTTYFTLDYHSHCFPSLFFSL